ncbi:MAG: helix-turn-helix domain-containing protein [Candidatus Aenigmatarchaeota archaeon]
MTNYNLDTSKLIEVVRSFDKEKREDLRDELSPEIVEDIENEIYEGDLEVLYTVGEIGRIPTEDLGLTYPKLKIDGDKFRKWRKSEFKIQTNVAEQCGVCKDIISKIENNKRNIRPKTAKKIIKGTGLSRDYLGLPEFVYEEDDLSKKGYDILVGCLLGDGSIEKREDKNNRFTLNGRDMRYVGYIQQELGNVNIYGNIVIGDHDGFKTSRFQSKALALYNEESLMKKFYDELENSTSEKPKYRKKVPEDLDLNSTVAKLWYMGHGSLIRKGKYSPYVNISSLTYPKEEVEILREKLSEKFTLHNLYQSSNYEGKDKGYIIGISTESTQDFFHWIGKCPNLAKDAISNESQNSRMKDKWL